MSRRVIKLWISRSVITVRLYILTTGEYLLHEAVKQKRCIKKKKSLCVSIFLTSVTFQCHILVFMLLPHVSVNQVIGDFIQTDK